MRQCRTCGESKPLMDFYRQTNGTLQRDCKDCWKAKVKAHRLVNIGHYKAFDAARANRPDRVAARAAYQQTEAGRKAANMAKRRYLERNPIKRKAHSAAKNAIRDGIIKKAPCEICGATRAQAHHDDYSKPLDVRWLCTKHHAEWHKTNTPKCPEQEQAA